MSTTHIKERTYGSQLKRERSRSRSPRGDDLSRTKRLDEDTTRQPDGSKKLENVGLGAKNRLKSMSIQMKLGSRDKVNKRKLTVASVFNQDSDSEPEEVPPEAKMRMRNIGRDTPTSSGPNSFGKTKQGFSDAKKVFEKNLKEAMENALADD